MFRFSNGENKITLYFEIFSASIFVSSYQKNKIIMLSEDENLLPLSGN